MRYYDVSQADSLKKVYIQLTEEGAVFSDIAIKMPEDAVRALGKEICDMDREMMYVINLRCDHTPINVMCAGIGTESASLCSAASLMRAAILSNATAMVLVHNHPSGDLSPSSADIKFADRMIQICMLHDIDFLDSVIVAYGKKECYSMAREETCDFYLDNNKYAKSIEDLHFPSGRARSISR